MEEAVQDTKEKDILYETKKIDDSETVGIMKENTLTLPSWASSSLSTSSSSIRLGAFSL